MVVGRSLIIEFIFRSRKEFKQKIYHYYEFYGTDQS